MSRSQDGIVLDFLDQLEGMEMQLDVALLVFEGDLHRMSNVIAHWRAGGWIEIRSTGGARVEPWRWLELSRNERALRILLVELTADLTDKGSREAPGKRRG